VNVEITYDGGHTKEYLDLDAQEGFTVPDLARPQVFKLAPGLCEMWRGVDAKGAPTTHRISSIRASGTCSPKVITQPICAADQLKLMGAADNGDVKDVGVCKVKKLTPTKGALAVVIDNTTTHAGFFNPGERARDVGLTIKDPAFDQTQIAMFYAPGAGAAPACGVRPPDLLQPILSSNDANIAVLDSLKNTEQSLVSSAPAIEGGLLSSYAYLSGLDVGRRAVLVIGNNGLDTSTCGDAMTPSALATAARTADPSKPIFTYALQVLNTKENPGDGSAALLAQAGSPLNAKGEITYIPIPDTTENKKNAFQEVINRLATCSYDMDAADAPATDAQLNYADPLTSTEVKIPFNAACVSDSSNSGGWGFDAAAPAGKKRIVVCGDDCTTYQKKLSAASSFTLLYGQPGLPVPMYVTPKACETN